MAMQIATTKMSPKKTPRIVRLFEMASCLDPPASGTVAIPGAEKGEEALLGDSDGVGRGVSIDLTQFSSPFEFTILSQSGAILDWNLTFSDHFAVFFGK
jgi:hypothetical protein